MAEPAHRAPVQAAEDDLDDLVGFCTPASLEGRTRVIAPEPVFEPEPDVGPAEVEAVAPDAEPDLAAEVAADPGRRERIEDEAELAAAVEIEPELTPEIAPAAVAAHPDLFVEPTPEPALEAEPTPASAAQPAIEAEPVAAPLEPVVIAAPSPAARPAPRPEPEARPRRAPEPPLRLREPPTTTSAAAVAAPPSRTFGRGRDKPKPIEGIMGLYSVYAMILFAVPTFGVSALIGLLAVTGRQGPTDELARSHFVYQQRTLWAAALIAALGAILIVVGLGVFVLFALALWTVARGTWGVWKLKNDQPIPAPRSWMFR